MYFCNEHMDAISDIKITYIDKSTYVDTKRTMFSTTRYVDNIYVIITIMITITTTKTTTTFSGDDEDNDDSDSTTC